MNDNLFFNVLLPSYSKSNCSPVFANDYNGLLIAMPTKIDLSEHVEIPICGSFRVSSNLILQTQGKLIEHVMITFIDCETQQSLSFDLMPDKEPIRNKEKTLDITSKTLEDNYIFDMYFNIDVFNFFSNFPQHKANYSVFATVLNIQSNTLKTSILTNEFNG